jgi:hypothetical protein
MLGIHVVGIGPGVAAGITGAIYLLRNAQELPGRQYALAGITLGVIGIPLGGGSFIAWVMTETWGELGKPS